MEALKAMKAPDPIPLFDLHVHPALPWIGEAWRRRVQGFHSTALGDDPARPSKSRMERSLRGDSRPLADPPIRQYGAVFYVTYLLRAQSAHIALFRSLESFRARFAAGGNHPHVKAGRIILTAADLVFESPDAAVGSAGREACFLAVESMRCLRDPGDVRRLWDLGVRSLQPIHFLDTPWGGSSREGLLPSSRTGLTGLGREMLSEMAKLGLILDLAHMSVPNAEDCLAAYPGPVMCSHTGLSSIRATARNITPELAKEVFRRRGLVGVTCWRHLLGGGKSRYAWTRSYCDTVTALADLDPDARVVVGSDRGAPIHAPAWFYSPEHLTEMATMLSGLGWTSDRIRGFFSGNAVGFLGASLPSASVRPAVHRP